MAKMPKRKIGALLPLKGNLMTFTVIFRTGGTANAKWRKVLSVFTDRKKAQTVCDVINRQGYKAIIHDTEELESIGMPTGWDANETV